MKKFVLKDIDGATEDELIENDLKNPFNFIEIPINPQEVEKTENGQKILRMMALMVM